MLERYLHKNNSHRVSSVGVINSEFTLIIIARGVLYVNLLLYIAVRATMNHVISPFVSASGLILLLS